MRPRIRILPILLLLLFWAAQTQSGEESRVLDGFSAGTSARQLDYEARIAAELSPKNAELFSRELTSRPHLAGTEGARITAQYIKDQLHKSGLPAEIVEYTGYLSEPVSISIELVQPVREQIPTTEDRIASDPFTDAIAKHPGWSAYSPSGQAEGAVVYASYGSEADIQRIQSMGVDLKGKILLMRYFGTGEGDKLRNAERVGAAGVILYSDPKEDGYRYGDVYPKGNWRPAGSIMRRPVLPFWYDGDPLSPGWASAPGAKRLKPEEIEMPKIPVLPISYRSAQRILSLLEGPVAPYRMQGDLPIPYKLGPGPATVKIRTEMNNGDRPMLDVISRIEGEKYKDQWIIVGNHHDAWIYGAGDPSSGTASLLEFARGLGAMMKQGYRPQRTLILAFWDAEEMMLGGSTEWLEDHKQDLLKNAVACINMDSSVFNIDRPLSVNAHPALHRLFREVTRSIKDPRTGKSMNEVWRDQQNQYRTTPSVDGWGEFFDSNRELKEPSLSSSPSDDAAPFFNQLALPASDMYYGADYGMYHSIYENFHWMKTVVDPTFEYHVAMAQLQGFAALRLANADFIPLDFAGEARFWRKAYLSLKETADKRKVEIPRFQEAMGLIDGWEKEAEALTDAETKWRGVHKNPRSEHLEEFNRKIFQMARDFYRPDGRREFPLERNLWSGSDGSLPALRASVERSDTKAIQAEATLYLRALQQRVIHLRALHQDFTGSGAKP